MVLESSHPLVLSKPFEKSVFIQGASALEVHDNTKRLSCAEVVLVLVFAGVSLHSDEHVDFFSHSNVFVDNGLRSVSF